MKNKGLKNRFPERINQFWIGSNYWYECAICGQNHSDCIHHIISPASFNYVAGKHNESIFNSCRLNNENCHLYKPMQNTELQRELLRRTYKIVMEEGAILTKDDYSFLLIYKDVYGKEFVGAIH